MSGRLYPAGYSREKLSKKPYTARFFEETGSLVGIVRPVDTFQLFRGQEKAEHLGVSFGYRNKSGEIKIAPEGALPLITGDSARRAIKLLIKARESGHA